MSPKALQEALLDFKVKAEPIRSQIKRNTTAEKKEKPKPKGAAKKAAKK